MTVDAIEQEQELFWSQLLDSLMEGRVIPIVGQDLLDVKDGGNRVSLASVVSQRALALLALGAECPTAQTLHDAAVCCLSKGGRAGLARFYWAVDRAVSDPALPIPDVLLKLAEVDAFKLYVTTAVDPFLQRAIDEVRFGGAPRTQVYAYSLTQRRDDLPSTVDEMHDPAVYHLFGRTSAAKTCALTEEDMLEYMHSLQSAPDRPKTLLAELGERSLLFIGSGYSDWLARFFLRVTRGRRLFDGGAVSDFLADARVARDDPLVQFLKHFSEQTQVFPGNARHFVDELVRRWQARPRDAVARGVVVEPVAPQSVFLSYPSEHLATARRIADALRAEGVPVWLDKRALHGGDDFKAKIHLGIRRASLFIPVLSRSVLTNERRFFFREWLWAIDASEDFGFDRTFIVPCRIDDVPPDAPHIPPKIQKLTIADVREDAALAEFVLHVRELFRAYRLQESRL